MDYFKDYILNEEPKIYPDSYLKNKRLMDLVKTHKDPMKFLFAVITQMNRGKLNLKRIGAASTREVAALWNDFNDNKINMSMVESVLQERRETIKGWVNPQKKKVIQTKGMKPYHVMMIAKNPRQFGMQQKTILNRLENDFDAMDSPEPEADAKEHLAALKSGVRDVDRSVEVLAMKRGWYRVYGGEWCEISGVKSLSDRELTQILELMQENGMIAYGGREMKELELQVYVPPKKNDNHVDVKPDGRLQQFEIQNLLSGRKRGFKQTEIGRTMAMFREEVNEKVYADSGLGKWFGKGGKGGTTKGGWDRYDTTGKKIGKCGDAKPGEGTPKCLSKAKADKLRRQGGKKAIANAVKRKKAKDSVRDKPGTGNKPVNVSNRIDKDPKKKGIQDSVMKSFNEYLEEKNVPTNPSLWSQAKSKAKAKFDVYPSAYANAWASKWYKSQGGSWRTEESVDCGCNEMTEEVTIMENGEKKNVKLNDPIRTSEVPSKKFKVYVRNEKGKVVVVRFGDPNMEIKRDDPKRRKSFRARHNCSEPGPKTKARYWSCYQWRGGDKKVDN